MSKRAIITGVAGQDGSYLAEFLLSKNYDVYGVYKRVSRGNDFSNLKECMKDKRFKLIELDICDTSAISHLIAELKPDEFYNLAAQSHVGYSFETPLETFKIDAEAVVGQLEAIRRFSPQTKFYQASTSELFGGINCPVDGYTELSKFHPRSPYGVAKAAAYYSVVNYREAYKIFACNGILFNHSSPRRGLDFATRKITHGVAKIKMRQADNLLMGNLEAIRDEGHSKDYVEAMWLMLQQDKADDYIVSTGVGAKIKDMLQFVCELANLDIKNVYVEDERFMRPSEVHTLLGNNEKIRAIGWTPKYNWKNLLTEMYQNDLLLLGWS